MKDGARVKPRSRIARVARASPVVGEVVSARPRRLKIPLLVGLMLTACQVPAGPERALEGREIYERHCARCHGIDGKGDASMPAARDLSNAAYMAGRSDDQLRGAIMRGVPPNMPSFGGQFLEPSMKVLVAYIRGFDGPVREEPAAAPVKQPSSGAAP